MAVRCRCGAPLVEEITDEGVKPVGGEPIRFRRTTDFVICQVCHSMYRIDDLRAGRSMEESFAGVQEDDGSTVEALERLLDNGDAESD